ncbi:MAG: BMP family ABC transporter substrate-binding protein [Nitrososphaerota archaeon]
MSREKISRRRFLSGASRAAVVGGAAAGLVIGGVGGYFAGQSTAPVTTKTTTVATTVTAERGAIRAGYFYPGPAKDYGWSYAHDLGRRYADSKVPGSSSAYIELVPDPEASSAIKSLLDQGANLIFACSFGFMDAMVEAARNNPDKYFVHISGYKSGAAPEPNKTTPNMSTAFAEFYQLYYLNGLAAGAVTQTGVVGYVGAFPIPEVVRHINAFVLGANVTYKRRTGKNIKAYVLWINSWVDPPKAREAAIALIEDQNADVLGYTEDTPTVLQVAEEYTTQKGRRVWSFSHYSDMTQFGPNAHLTGQIVNWGPIYAHFYRLVATNSWEPEDIWTRLGDMTPWRWSRPIAESLAGQPDGTVYLAPLSPAIPAETTREIKQRYEEMKELIFEPFSPEGNLGEPIRDQDGNIRIDKGQRADREFLWSDKTMNFFVEYIESPFPRG